MYNALNIFFFAFHSLLILFNTFGWTIPRLRKWNLATLLLTAFSWFVLGIWYGWGYCFCTDWHWQVRRHLGYTNDPNSYVQLLLRQLLHVRLPAGLVDTGTAVVFFVSLAVSIWLNLRDYRRR
ncbi:MAG TPA: DUF2784 domain-containing protein [Puia sp.]|nr:DUF2784 domain-containing protein [Puia sp.]